MSDGNVRPEETFDWMKFLKLHPIVVAGSLIVSGAAGGVAGYFAFSSFVEKQVMAALAKINVTNAVANKLVEEHADTLRGEQGQIGDKGEKGDPGRPGSGASFPPGAVVAFDLADGCPVGWSDVGTKEAARFAGRTLIASGPRVDRQTSNGTTLKRSHNDQGGEERVVLKPTELAAHSHGISDPQHAHKIMGLMRRDEGVATHGWAGAKGPYANDLGRPAATGISIMPTDAAESHSNMPPYIALYFCKKD